MILKISDRFKNRRVTYFNDVTVNLKYDAIASTFQFNYLFDPDNVEQKEFSCIGHYHLCEIFNDNNELILTGFILNNRFVSKSVKGLNAISGYSLPGVLEDCEVPPLDRYGNKVPGYLESNNLKVREIVKKICDLFGIQMVIHSSASADMEDTFDSSDAKASQSVKSYFADMVSQKNIIMTSDEYGRIVFTKPIKTKPIFHFEPDNLPGVSMTLDFNGQGVHSVITVFAQQGINDSDEAAEDSIDNPYIPNRNNVFRPKVVTMSSKSTNDLDVVEAAKNIRAKELRNLTLVIEMDRWDLNGVQVRPGQIISVTNKEVYLYKKTDWFIEDVTLREEPDKKIATLKCVPPESFTGDDPVYPFRGVNLHPIE